MPDTESGVFGVVMDIGFPEGSATVVALADGTGSMYTSTGGGVIGGGAHPRVASTARWAVSTARAHLPTFQQSTDLGVPAAGGVRITVLTTVGPRTVVAAEDELGGEQHPASPVFFAVHEVISAMRVAEQGLTTSEAPTVMPDGVTRLMAAAHQGHPGAVWTFIDEGDPVDAQDDVGYTALMYAANAGHPEVVRALLERGANPNATDADGSTPLMFAAQGDHVAIVQLLLAAGGDPRPAGSHGLTALGFARQNGHAATEAVLSAVTDR